MNFVDPKTDIAFKKIFGSSEHKIVLIEFLNTVLELEHLIEDVTVIDPYQPPKTKGLKETTLDVRATDQKGNQFIVEMQVEKEVGFYKRVILVLTDLLAEKTMFRIMIYRCHECIKKHDIQKEM